MSTDDAETQLKQEMTEFYFIHQVQVTLTMNKTTSGPLKIYSLLTFFFFLTWKEEGNLILYIPLISWKLFKKKKILSEMEVSQEP